MIALTIAVGAVVAAGLVFMRPSASRGSAAAVPTTQVALSTLEPTTTSSSSTTSTAPATTTTSTPDVGALPQTRDKPSGSDPALVARIQLLVSAVASGDPSGALPAFFPESAYVQVKTVANPAGDWKYRLVALFDQDIVALHRSLGSNLTFSGVDVPDASAQWVNPGAEYNRIGYWRVYNTRVRYRSASGQSSFVVISMISWRGQWYVVHFRTPPK